MLDIKYIRENAEKVKAGIKTKGYEESLIDDLLVVDQERRSRQQALDSLRSEQRSLDYKNPDDLAKAKEIKARLETIESELNEHEKKYLELLMSLPNIPADDVPVGRDESENVVVRTVGTPPQFDFPVKDHMDLGKALGLIDTEKAGQISGARFAYIKGKLAMLEFAIVQHVLTTVTNEEILKKIATDAGLDVITTPFIPVVPPVFIRPEVMQRMARLEPKEERYYIPSDDLYLIGSAEHTLGPLHMDEILSEKELPLRYIGFSTSFRREAGSYGKDTKGILRLHQFDKLEMESFTLPEDSIKEQDFIVAIQEYLVQSLGLPYQLMAICTGDMGGPDARQFDINTWMPGQNKYRETHTSDLMTDYQSRRLNTRVKQSTGETQFVHMNDATAFAIGRILIAILENGQQPDGSVKIPEALATYTGFDTITAQH